MAVSMPGQTQRNGAGESAAGNKPRVGVPWRAANEEAEGQRDKYQHYLDAIRQAGGEPVEISLAFSRREFDALARTLDAVVLPGSPADVDPGRYGSKRHPKTADADSKREHTDYALLHYAFAAKKPVLAICYGTQQLNVYLGGTLLQDISSELHTTICHSKQGLPPGSPDPSHRASIKAGSKLAALPGLSELTSEGFSADVNSSHHQSILTPGRGLRITAQAPDGVIEAVEWTGDAHWVVGVQWHPERMKNDHLAEALFRELIAATRVQSASVRG